MTDLKFEILGILYGKTDRRMNETELNNLFVPGRVMPAKYAVDELITDGYLRQDHGSENVTLTPEGSKAFESEQDNRRKESQAKEQCRRDNLHARASTIIAIIMSAIAFAELIVIIFQGLQNP